MRIVVGKVSADRTFDITLCLRTTEKVCTVRLDPSFDDGRRSFASRASSLATSLKEQCPELVRSLLRAYRSYDPFVLEIKDSELYDVPWESAFHRLLPKDTFRYCVRVVPEAAPRPSRLPPYHVLWADVADPTGSAYRRRPPRELKHYANTIGRQTTPEALTNLVSGKRFEVVHLAGVEALKTHGGGRLKLAGSRQTLSPDRLGSLLESPPKLLVLEGISGSKSALMEFAHRYTQRTGTAVLVDEPLDPEASRDLAETVYLGIAHDQALDQLVANLRARAPEEKESREEKEPSVLIVPHGGEQALRLDVPEYRVRSWYRDLKSRTSTEIDRLREITKAATVQGARSSHLRRMQDFQGRIEKARAALDEHALEFSYHAESEGIEPMAAAVKTAAKATSVIDEVTAVTERVVNTCFLWRGRPVPKEHDLVCGRNYLLQVQIGRLSPHSNNRSPRGVPEKDLERYMEEDGVSLRVVAQSRHFQIVEHEKELKLPPWPLESEPQTLEVVAPTVERSGEILLLLYYRTNLLQAIRLWAWVRQPGAKTEPKGNYAETEFALEQLSEAVKELPPRDVQLYVSLSHNPTHTLTLDGTGDKHHFELSDGKLSKALDTCRVRLLQLAEHHYGRRRGRQSSIAELLEDLLLLAQTGVTFFETLLPKGEREALARKVAGHRNLQVGHSKSLEQIYPWALVYDHPLFAIEPRLCPEVEQLLTRHGATVSDLEQLRCMMDGCPHRGDTDVICPSGFWGFRHTLELPLSLARSADDDADDDAKTNSNGMARSIQAAAKIGLCMGAWRDFKSLHAHAMELGKIAALQVDGPAYRKGDLVQALRHGQQHILYLYCHGDHNPAVSPPTVLKLGWQRNEDYVYGTDMSYLVQLQSPRPLVFVNGCHTLDTDPNELVSLNRKLSEGGAAGVIGTEIKVPEDLAAPAGQTLLAALVGGTPLSLAMRRFRLGLLLERNVLGLAYTAFGFSGLTLKAGSFKNEREEGRRTV